ncbi:SDR family NAD(P)-dependent oxidoreductase [Kribbella sp. NPDC049584]|uniref:SDR family NAD(P)-dependent oxidoreductase n=1 Tax=Kribbella sp. NPDC049584 TaxID=3154833 RepID=UPI0034340DA5
MKSCVVTGASSGIGRATAVLLAENGHRVFATVRKESDAHALARTPGITPVFMDVGDAEQVAEAVAKIRSEVGEAGLDGLVNNAGSGTALPLELMAPAQLRHQLEVNTIGQLAVTQALLPALRQARGRVVMIGSIGVRAVPPFTGPIVVPKAALTALTHILRQELAPWGIRTILVDPASIRTDAGEKLAAAAQATVENFSAADRALYGAAYKTMTSRFLALDVAGSPPSAVATVILHALTDQRPRAHYTVGRNRRRLSMIPRLPIRLADALRRRVFGIPGPGSAIGVPR